VCRTLPDRARRDANRFHSAIMAVVPCRCGIRRQVLAVKLAVTVLITIGMRNQNSRAMLARLLAGLGNGPEDQSRISADGTRSVALQWLPNVVLGEFAASPFVAKTHHKAVVVRANNRSFGPLAIRLPMPITSNTTTIPQVSMTAPPDQVWADQVWADQVWNDRKDQGVVACMKSVVYSRTGDPSVLQLVDREVAEPGPGEVRVRIVVSGVNPTDWKLRRGSGAGAAPPFPEVTPNQDGAGVVDAVGEGVEKLAVGDRVWVYLAGHQRPTGTAQEYTILPADRVVRLPASTSFDIGASLGVPAMTAHRALTVSEDGPDRLHPGALAGKTVLVAGGAGAVGHAAIQLARWAGATVITTVSSPAKAALATAAGAHHVINYREEDAATAIREVASDGVDLVVEVAIAANSQLNIDVAKPRASIAIYANDGGGELTLNVRQNMIKNLRYQYVLLYTVGDAALTAAVEDITVALEEGALPVGEDAGLPLHRFRLAETAEAHQAAEDGAVGKVLIDVGSS
jgi:NADPH:quinone reductase